MAFAIHYLGSLYSLCKYVLLSAWFSTFKTPAPFNDPPTSTSTSNAIISFQEWVTNRSDHDAVYGIDDWVHKDPCSYYDWQIVKTLKRDLENSRRGGDYLALCSQLRAQSSRNMCRILSPALYQKSEIQTKALIQDYVREVRRSVRFVATRELTADAISIITVQERLQLLHDMRQALGRTSLVLQGGAAASLCHFGVAKSLHENHLLPQIVTGTATGALIAALIGTTKDRDLKEVLDGRTVDVSAFETARVRKEDDGGAEIWPTWIRTIRRRWRRYKILGHVFNIDVIQQCVRDNLGDITFEEAYEKTGRILNITIAMSDSAGTPQLLNYITAPHVLISSAVVASIATSRQMYAPVQLYCKSETGIVSRYVAADVSQSHPPRRPRPQQQAPLQRIGELFNVNHFVVSQTRPYITPFVRLQRWADQYFLIGKLLRMTLTECRHWLEVLGRAGCLPSFLQRILVDEVVPNFAPWAKLTITPDIGIWDLVGIFNNPTLESIQDWKLRGEKGVWPVICQIKVRCIVEFELEDCYSKVRRRGIPVGD